MYDHIHRQLASSRHADLQRAQPSVRRRRDIPEKSPPWIRRHARRILAR